MPITTKQSVDVLRPSKGRLPDWQTCPGLVNFKSSSQVSLSFPHSAAGLEMALPHRFQKRSLPPLIVVIGIAFDVDLLIKTLLSYRRSGVTEVRDCLRVAAWKIRRYPSLRPRLPMVCAVPNPARRLRSADLLAFELVTPPLRFLIHAVSF